MGEVAVVYKITTEGLETDLEQVGETIKQTMRAGL